MKIQLITKRIETGLSVGDELEVVGFNPETRIYKAVLDDVEYHIHEDCCVRQTESVSETENEIATPSEKVKPKKSVDEYFEIIQV